MWTSRKFKKDLIEYFKDNKYKEMTGGGVVVVSDTTKVLSSLFKNVYKGDLFYQM